MQLSIDDTEKSEDTLMLYGRVLTARKLSKKIERLNQYQNHFGVDNTKKIAKAKAILDSLIDEADKDLNCK